MNMTFRRSQLSEQVWLKVFRADALSQNNGRCQYCGSPVSMKSVTADHKHPRIKGGTTTRENIAAACRECNLTKGSMSPAAFLRRIKNPQPGDSFYIRLAHFRYRLWKATDRACKNIVKVCK